MIDKPLIINFTPTGAVSDPAKNPHVPITIDAIVADVRLAGDAGAAIAHLHVRNADGSASSDPVAYARLLGRLREDTDLILCASTSGRHGQSKALRAEVLKLDADLRPDMASLTLGAVQFAKGKSENDLDTVRFLAETMLKFGVKPELEVFDVSMVSVAIGLIEVGLLQPPYYFNLLLGNVVGLQPTLQDLAKVLALLPAQSIVSVGGIGRHQYYSNLLGVLHGDGVRVGLEDNIWTRDEPRQLARNSDLVASVLGVAREVRRPIATVIQTRQLLGLAPRPSSGT